MAHIKGGTPAERRVELQWLEEKKDRTPAESLRMLELRLAADNPDDDAKLFIAYRDAGAFRRVLCDGLTGVDLRGIVNLAIQAKP